MKPFVVNSLAGLLVLSVVGHALGQSTAPPSQADELHYRPNSDQNSTPSGDTTITDDTTQPSTPTYNNNNNNNQNQLLPFQPQNNDDQLERPDRRRRPRPPFNPFAFLLTPPSFNSDPTEFSPFHPSPLLNLLNGGGLFDLASPRDFRAQMDEQIKDMEGKPDVWSKEMQQYTINGVKYEKITFTRKVDDQSRQQTQIDMEDNEEREQQQQQQQQQQQENLSQPRQRSSLFSRPNFSRSLSNLI